MDLRDKYLERTRNLVWVAIGLYIFRVLTTHEVRFLFMSWNLFLAWLPYYFAKRVGSTPRSWMRMPLTICWFFFLPNSFYMFTDLIHLQWSNGIFKVFDAMLVTAYALSGAGYGYLSVRVIQPELGRIYRMLRIDHILGTSGLFLLCSFGVYIGRFGRWNSWDLVYRPLDLMEYSVGILRLSDTNLHMFVFTSLFWLFLVVVYSVFFSQPQNLKTA